MKKYKTIKSLILIISIIITNIFTVTIAGAATKTVSATISTEKVMIGKTLPISSKTKDVTYKSSDTNIAYVNSKGVITGKKKGSATISVNKTGYNTKKFIVTVVANGKKPDILVCYDEIKLINGNVTGDGKYSAQIKNNSKNTIKKVEYIFETEVTVKAEKTETDKDIKNEETESGTTGNTTDDTTGNTIDDNAGNTVEESSDNSETENTVENTSEDTQDETGAVPVKTEIKTVKLTAVNIGAGKTSNTLTCEGPASGAVKDMKLQKVLVYSGKALITYNTVTDTFSYTWGTKDTTPPVISGMVGKNSHFGENVFMVVYPDKEYDFTKYVTVTDDRDNNLKLNVDTSGINYKKEGTYTITCSVKDSAGNSAKAKAKVYVRLPIKVDTWADQVLKNIVKDSWSDEKKARAIYTYIRKNFSYVDHSDKSSWEKSAEYGLKYKSGDCFTYFSTAKLLLTRSGIPNLMIIRSQGVGHHWWNLAYIEGGWYHYDTTPRKQQATFCLITDSQLTDYSNKTGGIYIWNSKKYPVRATKEISEVVWGKRY